jgi:hypothetical protein
MWKRLMGLNTFRRHCICTHLSELIAEAQTKSQFMLDLKMWSQAPYGGWDAIAEVYKGQIELYTASPYASQMF